MEWIVFVIDPTTGKEIRMRDANILRHPSRMVHPNIAIQAPAAKISQQEWTDHLKARGLI
jgi:hypothetical protein